jgi:hypothetical protein
MHFGWTRRITRDVIITRDTERKKKRVCLHEMLFSPASRTSSSSATKKKKTDGEDDDDDVDANAKATKSAEDDDDEEEDNDEKKTKSNDDDKMSSLAEFLTTFSKLLETREGIDKTLKTVKYASVLSALVLTTNTDKTVEIFSLASDPKTRERTAQKLRKLAKSLSLSRGSLRLGKFLKFSLQCREHLALDAAREEEEEEKDNDDADDDGSRFRLSSSKRQRRALEFLALFAEATYYFLEQGVWLQNVGVFRSEDAAKRKELKVLAMKVEFFMYATSIPLRVVEWRDLDGRERAAREKKNEAAAYERSMSTSKRLLSFISSPQKRGDEVGDRMEDTKSDGEFALAKANAVKSIVKDGLDLVLVTSDLEWIRERRARDFVANEWVYSTLSLSSALISISKLWVKAMRA